MPSMTKDELRAGFAKGREVTQEEWADHAEIEAVDALIAEGAAEVTAPWEYKDNFQCSRRKVRGLIPDQEADMYGEYWRSDDDYAPVRRNVR